MDFSLEKPSAGPVTQPEAPAVLPSSLPSALTFVWSIFRCISAPVDQIYFEIWWRSLCTLNGGWYSNVQKMKGEIPKPL